MENSPIIKENKQSFETELMIISYIKCSLKMQDQEHSITKADRWHIELEMFGYANDSVLLLPYTVFKLQQMKENITKNFFKHLLI